MVALAIESGIPVDVWWAGDERDLATALVLLNNQRQQESEQQRPRRSDDGRQMSG